MVFAEEIIKEILYSLKATANYRIKDRIFISGKQMKSISKGELDLLNKAINLLKRDTDVSPEVFNLTRRDLDFLIGKGHYYTFSNKGTEIILQYEEEVKK